MTNRDFFVRCWEDEYPVFLKTFKAVPANRLDYEHSMVTRRRKRTQAMHVRDVCESKPYH